MALAGGVSDDSAADKLETSVLEVRGCASVDEDARDEGEDEPRDSAADERTCDEELRNTLSGGSREMRGPS